MISGEVGAAVLALSASELRELVPMRTAVELMKQVFAAESRDETISPLRTPVNMPDGSGVVLYMPAFVPALGDAPAASGAKVVSVFGGNRERGIPTIHAIVVCVDPETGAPLGILEGASITALRTGAVSGAATDLLAREDATTLAIIGAGAQGVTQAAAVCAVRPITTIRVFDVFAESRNSFAERLSGWMPDGTPEVIVADSAEAAVRDADIICTATTATSPVFEDAWVKDGAHINAIGAYTPEMQEVPDATLARALIVVDVVEAALHEAGDLIQAIGRGSLSEAQVQTELGQLVTGQAQGRRDAAQVTFFKSVGNAIQDMIVAGTALQLAAQQGRGTTVTL